MDPYNTIIVDLKHGIGDVIQMVPFMKRLKQQYPGSQITAIVKSKEHYELLKTLNVVSHPVYFNKNDVLGILKKLLQLRKSKFEIGIIAPISTQWKMKLLFSIIGCKKIIYNQSTIPAHKKNAVLRNLEMLRDLNIDFMYEIPNLNIGQYIPNKEVLDTIGYKGEVSGFYVGLCVRDGKAARGAKFNYKKDTAKYADFKVLMEVANELTKHGYKILLLGGATDCGIVSENISLISSNDKIINLVGSLNLDQTLAVLKLCKVVIGGDFGLIHAADALKVRTIVYYGSTSPDVVGPFSNLTKRITANLPCQYCYRTKNEKKCQRKKCIEYLNASVILKAFDEFRLDLNEDVNRLITDTII
ncbi:glycosyltransferase family 9 protein [Macellibacteroides fermentans]|uniref:glycosyltransferase family 9 protein n=1 Tax=Macellibacteroides fermentans TaxID=879969 RepID=UPI00406C34B3